MRMPDPEEVAPLCPGPDPHPRGPTRYRVPAGAVDTHAHVIGAPPAYPFVAERGYTAPEATTERYLAMLDATGMTYGVLVQVSVHGTDNRALLAALAPHRDRLKGIAVIPLGLPDRELAALSAAGIVGLRLNVLYGGGVGLESVESYGALCREMGWHLQFLLDARTLPPLAARLGGLPVPIVIDHMGHFPSSAGIGDPGFRTLLGLVRDGAWVKLQGVRNSVSGPPYHDTIPFAQLLSDAAPDRCLWGSDWPHVANWGPMPKIGDLLDLVMDWVPDESRRRLLFADNPHRLYGFGGDAVGGTAA